MAAIKCIKTVAATGTSAPVGGTCLIAAMAVRRCGRSYRYGLARRSNNFTARATEDEHPLKAPPLPPGEGWGEGTSVANSP